MSEPLPDMAAAKQAALNAFLEGEESGHDTLLVSCGWKCGWDAAVKRLASPIDDRGVREAAKALLAKLDAALPGISSAITISTIHHCPYDGPPLDDEVEALRTALA